MSEAPLKSPRDDLGLSNIAGTDAPSTQIVASNKFKLTTIVRARVEKLENDLSQLEAAVTAHAQGIVALATRSARTDNRIYAQYTSMATIHMAQCGTMAAPAVAGHMRGHELAARNSQSEHSQPHRFTSQAPM